MPFGFIGFFHSLLKSSSHGNRKNRLQCLSASSGFSTTDLRKSSATAKYMSPMPFGFIGFFHPLDTVTTKDRFLLVSNAFRLHRVFPLAGCESTPHKH